MEKFFKLKENGTSVGTEVVAGFTTFFAMAYIIVVNPSILSESGMEWGAVFLATIISAVIGTWSWVWWPTSPTPRPPAWA